MNLSKEIKTAIFAIAGFALFFIGFNYLKSNDVFVRDNIFYAEVLEIGENEKGIKKGDKVVVMPYISCGECACFGNANLSFTLIDSKHISKV